MITGGLLHHWLGRLVFLTPYLIFTMLFIPFCGVRLREMRISGLHVYLLLFQVFISAAAYLALKYFDIDVAQGAMICFLAPTASSAVVIAAMLGARVPTMLTYSLLVNFMVAVCAPLFFVVIAPSDDLTFREEFAVILWRVIPVLVMPFVAALALRRLVPKAADAVQRQGSVSFYLWLGALAITTAVVVNFVATQDGLTLGKGLWLAGVSLVICLVQFFAGKYIGSRYGETVAGGQALGQKNTILAIWLAQSCLNPASSIAPAAYVLWQTIFNSTQLWLKNRRDFRVAKRIVVNSKP